MRSISLILKQFSRSVLLLAGLTVVGFVAHAQGDADKGKALFQSKCTTCHKIDQQLVGPALGPQVTSETDDAYLTHWIQNNQALIAAKNPKAVAIYNKFNQANMSVFAELSDGDVANILAYIRGEWKTMQAAPKAGAAAGGAAAADTSTFSLPDIQLNAGTEIKMPSL